MQVRGLAGGSLSRTDGLHDMKKTPAAREGEEKRENRRGLGASVGTYLELLALGVFYHFPSQVNVFFQGILKKSGLCRGLCSRAS